MEISVRHEMIVFWGAFFCGQIIPFLFDFFRAMRKSYSCTKGQVAIQDIVFCFISFKIFFDICYLTNNGHLRWYIFISFILSAVIYFLSISDYIIKFWCFIFKILSALFSPVKKFLSFILKKLKQLAAAVKSAILLKFGSVFKKIRHNNTKSD